MVETDGRRLMLGIRLLPSNRRSRCEIDGSNSQSSEIANCVATAVLAERTRWRLNFGFYCPSALLAKMNTNVVMQ